MRVAELARRLEAVSPLWRRLIEFGEVADRSKQARSRAQEIDRSESVSGILARRIIALSASASAAVREGNIHPTFAVDVQIVEIKQIAVRTTEITTITAIQTDASHLHRVIGHPHRVEERILIKRVERVGDVEVVGGIVRCVVSIAIPGVSVDVRGVQQVTVLAAKISDCNPSRVARIDVRKDRRNDSSRADSDAVFFPRIARICAS